MSPPTEARARTWRCCAWPVIAAIAVGYALLVVNYDPRAHATEFLAMGDHGAAERALRMALQLQPDDAASYSDLGRCLHALDRAAESMVAFEAAVRLSPGDSFARGATTRLGIHLAQEHLIRHNSAPARGLLRRVLAIDPREANAYTLLGRALELERDALGASAAHGLALQLAPDDTTLLTNGGLTHYRAGRLDEAAWCFERVVALKPASGLLALVMLALSRPRNDITTLAKLRDAFEASSDAAPDDELGGTARALLLSAPPSEELGAMGNCTAAGLLARLAAKGYVVCDRVLGKTALSQLRRAAVEMRPRMRTHEGAVGVHPDASDASGASSARRDVSTRLPASDSRAAWHAALGSAASDEVRNGTDALRALMHTHVHRLLLHALPAHRPPLWPKEQLQLACYERGGFYRRHPDTEHPRDAGDDSAQGDAGGTEEAAGAFREFTAIYYANDEAWPLEDGGGLQLWPTPPGHTDADDDDDRHGPSVVIAPKGDRLLIFSSTLAHEVLPNGVDELRCAFTQWFWAARGSRLRRRPSATPLTEARAHHTAAATPDTASNLHV